MSHKGGFTQDASHKGVEILKKKGRDASGKYVPDSRHDEINSRQPSRFKPGDGPQACPHLLYIGPNHQLTDEVVGVFPQKFIYLNSSLSLVSPNIINIHDTNMAVDSLF